MFNKARIKQDFNRAAQHYDSYASLQRYVANALFSRMDGYATGQDMVLDIGSGTGYFQELARKYQHRWTICQLDLAYNMCVIAKRYGSLPAYGRSLTINGDMETIPLRASSTHAVFSSLMLQWVMDIRQGFAEVYRVLRPGGRCFFSTLIPCTLHELSESFEQNGFRSPVSLFRDKDYITTLLKEAGFEEVKVETERLVLHYDSLLQLMRSLKGVGGQNKMAMKNNHFIGKKGLEKIESYYGEYFGQPIPATWDVLYLTARK